MQLRIRRRTPSSHLQCVLGLLFVAVFLIGQIASFAHTATTSHAVCAEHGELVDVPAAQGSAVFAAERVEGPQWHAGPQEDSDHHDHCQWSAPLRDRTALFFDHSPSGSAPQPEFATIEQSRDVGHASIPLLLLAPKQSPPA